MDYDEIIAKAKAENELKRRAVEAEQERRKEERRAAIAKTKANFMALVVPEVESACKALNAQGITADLTNGETPFGPRRGIQIATRRKGGIYGITFRTHASEQEVRPPWVEYVLAQDGMSEEHWKITSIAQGSRITREHVQAVLALFLKQALK